jgi:CubicO group peptidase (beta-lactamase class C family)
VSALEAEGLDPAVIAALERAIDGGSYVAPDSIVVARNGRLVYESYRNGFEPDTLHDLRSATKSLTSLLVGLAIDRGRLRGPEERVLPFFPELATIAGGDERKGRIIVEHLLTMSSGLACDDWVASSPGNEERMYNSRDWTRFILALPMVEEPGRAATYCTGGVVLLGAILVRVTGESVPTFAADALFGPLGIEQARWDSTPEGGTDTGGHLRVRPRDLAKIGQLVVDAGRWKGRQVVPKEWIETSIRERGRLGDSGYAYLWWRNTFVVAGTPVDAVFARGNGGQYVFAFPSLGLVAAFTGSRYNDPSNSQPIEMCGRYVLPAALPR